MGVIELVPFETAHLDSIEGLNPLMHVLAEGYKKNGTAFTALYEGRPIGMAGVVVLYGGTLKGKSWNVGEAWTVFTDEFKQHPKFLHRAVKHCLANIAKTYNMIRIQASCKKDYVVGDRWLKSLGFVSEGDMPQFLPGETHVRYSKIRSMSWAS